MGFKLSRLFFSTSELCHKQIVGRDKWICVTCASKWSSTTYGEGWLPFACPEHKACQAIVGGHNGHEEQLSQKGPGSGAT